MASGQPAGNLRPPRRFVDTVVAAKQDTPTHPSVAVMVTAANAANTTTAASSSNARRRSSLVLRGHRCSRGGPLLQPHPEVPTADLCRHISPELPETTRMRMLLVWVGSRMAKSLEREREREVSNGGLANDFLAANLKKYQIDVLRAIDTGAISTSWHHSDRVPVHNTGVKLHPENVANRARVVALRAELEKLRDEEREWRAICEEKKTEHANFFDTESLQSLGTTAQQIEALMERALNPKEMAVYRLVSNSQEAPVEQNLSLEIQEMHDRISTAAMHAHQLKSTMQHQIEKEKEARRRLSGAIERFYPVTPTAISVPLLAAFAKAAYEEHREQSELQQQQQS